MKRFSVLFILALVLVSFATAQSFTKPKVPGAAVYTLILRTNPLAVSIFIDGEQEGGNIFRLPAGPHTITVRAPGYQDFSTQVMLNQNLTLPVTLQPQSNTQLMVNANVNGALVFLNGNQVGTTPFAGQLTPGTYTLLIRAPGYQDFSTQVAMSGPQTLSVTLQPLNYQLSLNANVNGALVFLNGNQVGSTPFAGLMAPGTYTLLIRAPGYQDFSTQVVMSGPQTLSIVLQPLNYQFSVNANVNGALVFLNGNQVGTTPFAAQVSPGNYMVAVSASGYQDWSTQVTVNGPQVLNVSLMPAMATLVFDMKPENFTREVRENRFAQVQVFVDNILQRGLSIPVAPGTHQIRIVSWGMQAVSNLSCEAGKTYRIAPTLTLIVQ